jgi:hypothetical protein
MIILNQDGNEIARSRYEKEKEQKTPIPNPIEKITTDKKKYILAFKIISQNDPI